MNTKGLKVAVATVALGLFTLSMNAQNSNGNRQGKERPSIEEIFKQMDANEDSQLSEAEAKGPLKKDFSKIDANEDGYLSKEEIEKAPKAERKERARNK